MDAIEVDGYYYLLTDMITFPYYMVRIPTVTVFDENLNKIKEIHLFDEMGKIMPVKLFYQSDFFYLTGLCVINEKGEKPFLMKFDSDFNIVMPLTAYTLGDTFNYGWDHVIMNKENEFIYSIFELNDGSHNRFLHVGNDGILRQDITIDQCSIRANIAEINDSYYIDMGEDYLLKLRKDSLSMIDSLPVVLHADDIPDATLIAVGNQLIRSNTCYVFHDECGKHPPLEFDQSIVFLDTNMAIQNRLVFGNPCAADLNAHWNISYINTDSIYYTYRTSSESWDESISIANFSHDGHLNFNYIFKPAEDSLMKTIWGCRAVSDGGVLVFGLSKNIFQQLPANGFLLKYHPQKDNLIVKEFSLEPSIQIYPNPAQSQVTVTNVQNAILRLYNTVGQEMFYTRNEKENAIINTDHLPNGVYIFKIEKENTILTRKIQIIR
jgi:hypothetical protein